ncbi:cytochrome c3 family protein [Caldithrix abyssi]
MKKIIAVLFLMLLPLSAAENTCQSCHPNVRGSCNLTCRQCHLSPAAVVKPTADHPAIIPNPSTERWWDEKCVQCHQQQVASFRKSLHYSNRGMIDQTLFLFGQSDRLFSTSPEAWKALKAVKGVETPDMSGVVNHLLAGKCLSCHFAADTEDDAVGRKHAAGCASCHVALDQQTGKPLHGHRFQKKIEDEVCLTCHSGNRVGADYYGYFEHDYHNQYNMPYGSKPRFGAFQHRLQNDVHQQAGMQCVDCHQEHVARSNAPRFEGEQPDVRCVDCHGGFDGSPAQKQDSVPLFSRQTVAHQDFHRKVRCSACHARWSFQDYGLHLFLDQSAHYEMWEDYIWQGDGEVARLLQQQLALSPQQRVKAHSTNKLSGEKMAGVWYKGWTFRRWETPVLGWDTYGKVSVIRPLYQYFITFVDSLDRVWIDSQKPRRRDGEVGWNWDAYAPHTIGKKGRTCESCHLNVKALGLGIRHHAQDSAAHAITLPVQPVLPGSRLLNAAERERLLKKSKAYKIWRSRAFLQEGAQRLFK